MLPGSALLAFLLALCASGAGSLRWTLPAPVRAARGAPSAVVTGGRVVGEWVEGAPGVARFLGIPYAASTAGAGRWSPPSAPDSWAPGTLRATAWGPACVQAQPPGDPDVPPASEQSEDCLSVNVFTAALGSTPLGNPVPVMLFFHGGAFVAGSSHGPWGLYDGSRFAQRGQVVVVSANYRLDALGWLVTSAKDGAQGNYGLLDQRTALAWVRDNCGAFGGDPGRVTLWGESAGGMSGLVHMVSPPSQGLFQRVIQQSNPAGFSYLTPAHAAVYGDALASKLGCGRPAKGQSQLDCLRGCAAGAVMNASLAVVSSYYDVARGSGFSLLEGVLQWGPVVDGQQVPQQPMAVVAQLRLPAGVDLLLGHNTDEVATFLDNSYYAGEFPSLVFDTVLVSIFGIRGSAAVKQRYAHTGLPAGVELLDLIMTDYWFRCAKEAVAVAVGSAGGRAWSYRFDANASFAPEVWPRFGLPQCVRKVCHAAELMFVFGNTGEWHFTEAETRFSEALLDAWARFAHTGDPNQEPGAGSTARRLRGDAAWPLLVNETRLSLVLTDEWLTESSEDLCAGFWDGVGYASAG